MTADYFATTVKFTIVNADAATVYVTKLQCRGKGLYADQETTVESSSAQPYGERPVTIQLPYQSDMNVAKDLADFLLVQYEDQSSQADSFSFIPHRSSAQMLAGLQGDIGQRVTVTETVTGLSSDLFITRVGMTVRQNKRLKCTFGVSASVFATAFWELETVGKSELGTTTWLAYG